MKLCICGYERSGTSVTCRLLAKAAGWSLLNDPPDSVRINIDLLHGKGMAPDFVERVVSHKIVKVPGFAAILRKLRTMFGDFKVLYTLRDPRDSASSVIERVKYGKQTSNLPLFWTPPSTGIAHEKPIMGIALRWKEYLEEAMRFEDDRGHIHFMKYEDFCVDKMGQLQLAARQLGIPFNGSKIVGALDVQFNKHLNAGVPRPIRGPSRWEQDLTPEQARAIEQICGPLMKEWGYSC